MTAQVIRSVLTGLLLTAVSVSPVLGAGRPDTIPVRAPSGKKLTVSGQILVMPKPGLSEQKLAQILERSGGRSKAKIKGLDVHIVEVPEQAAEAVVRALSHNPNIEFAELDELVEPNATANDTYFNNAWHLSKMGVTTAWDTSKGDGVVIAILDSGVNGSLAEMSGKLVAGRNVVSGNTDTADIFGHGTMVAGVAAAATNNAASKATTRPR